MFIISSTLAMVIGIVGTDQFQDPPEQTCSHLRRLDTVTQIIGEGRLNPLSITEDDLISGWFIEDAVVMEYWEHGTWTPLCYPGFQDGGW